MAKKSLSSRLHGVKDEFVRYYSVWEDAIAASFKVQAEMDRAELEFSELIRTRTAQAIVLMLDELTNIQHSFGQAIADRQATLDHEPLTVGKGISLRQLNRGAVAQRKAIKQLQKELLSAVELEAEMTIFIDRLSVSLTN